LVAMGGGRSFTRKRGSEAVPHGGNQNHSTREGEDRWGGEVEKGKNFFQKRKEGEMLFLLHKDMITETWLRKRRGPAELKLTARQKKKKGPPSSISRGGKKVGRELH